MFLIEFAEGLGKRLRFVDDATLVLRLNKKQLSTTFKKTKEMPSGNSLETRSGAPKCYIYTNLTNGYMLTCLPAYACLALTTAAPDADSARLIAMTKLKFRPG